MSSNDNFESKELTMRTGKVKRKGESQSLHKTLKAGNDSSNDINSKNTTDSNGKSTFAKDTADHSDSSDDD